MRHSLRTALLPRVALPVGPALLLQADNYAGIFASNAGTTAITDGAAAGFWGDQSGNGLDFTSTADDTTRPTWTLNGGLPYMSFDGTNDLLRRTADLDLHDSAGCSVFLAFNCPSTPAVGAALFGEGNGTGGNGFYYPFAVNATTGSTYRALVSNSAAGTFINGPNVTNVYTATSKVFGFTDNGHVVLVYMNGVLVDSLTYTRVANALTTLSRVSLGGFFSNAASAWCVARVFGVAAYKRALCGSEVRSLTRYMNRLAGI